MRIEADIRESFCRAEVFRRVSGTEGLPFGFELLTGGTNVYDAFLDVVMLEDRQFGSGVVDAVVSVIQGFQSQIIGLDSAQLVIAAI